MLVANFLNRSNLIWKLCRSSLTKIFCRLICLHVRRSSWRFMPSSLVLFWCILDSPRPSLSSRAALSTPRLSHSRSCRRSRPVITGFERVDGGRWSIDVEKPGDSIPRGSQRDLHSPFLLNARTWANLIP
jgi:hypothetical protein